MIKCYTIIYMVAEASIAKYPPKFQILTWQTFFFHFFNSIFVLYIYIYIRRISPAYQKSSTLAASGLTRLSHDKCPCGRKPGLSHYAVCTTSFGWTRLPLFSFNFTLKVTFCNLSRPFPKNMALAVPTTPSQQPKQVIILEIACNFSHFIKGPLPKNMKLAIFLLLLGGGLPSQSMHSVQQDEIRVQNVLLTSNVMIQ